MSHFTVMIIGEDPESQLAPFDENLETPRYVEYTRDQMIAKVRGEIEEYKNERYAEFLADPKKYKLGKSIEHINYLENEFPKKLNWTDDECYKEGIEYYSEDEIGSDGEVYSTSNPKSKWDWYSLGGRWSGMIKLKDGAKGNTGRGSLVMQNEAGIDQAKKGDILNFNELITFALIKDGQWFEKGEMGWWGVVSNKKDQEAWNNELLKLIKELPDETLISIYDCHI